MSLKGADYPNNNEVIISYVGNDKFPSGNKHLSKRILQLGTGLIPLINNSEKCCCEKACTDLCFNRLNHQECNRSICGLSDNLHDVYCNNRPFVRLNNQKTKKYAVECFKLPRKRGRKSKLDHLKEGQYPDINTRLILSENVSKGELIIECLGEMLTDSDVRDRYQKYFKLKKRGDQNVMNYSSETISLAPGKLFCLVEHFIYLDMTQMGNEAKHIRHSCNPNSQAEVWISRPNSHIKKFRLKNEFTISWIRMGIFALSDIEKGTEITIDYENLMSRCTPDLARSENPIRYLGHLECNCNYTNCRKEIGTRKIHESFEFSDFLIPTTNKKRRKDMKITPKSKEKLEAVSFSFNKNSFESFLSIREKLMEDQKTWKEQNINKKPSKTTQKAMSVFEMDKIQITQIQNSILYSNRFNIQLMSSLDRQPVWHLFSSLCWQGYYDHQECCNTHLIHNGWWEKSKEIMGNKGEIISKHIKVLNRPKRSSWLSYRASSSVNNHLNFGQIGCKSIFLHVMSHPWLLALNNLTNVDVELGRSWRMFNPRSVDLSRWAIIQRLTFFFNKFKITDEDLSWPIIDQGLGDDEKCTVCFCHGTLSSCDICFRSLHKSCLKKCNKFITSSSFCLPKWLPKNQINRESYFKELLEYCFLSRKSIYMSETSLYMNNKAKNITVVYNPKYSNNIIKNSSIYTQINQKNMFICHKCRISVHTNFWLRLKGREKRIVAKNAMKIRFARAYKAGFFDKSNGHKITQNNENEPKPSTKTNILSTKERIAMRSAKSTMNHLFNWRQRNDVFKAPLGSRIFNELSRDFKPKTTTDNRWERSSQPPISMKRKQTTYILNPIVDLPITFDSQDKLSVSVQDNCQIINSISIEDFIDSLRR
ncbi:SET and PHD domain-containing protein [Cryptosporidium canis]|uniref:SET and PHD domain-containing protein n=1 Tax=Cryptosporidium canis TaxID=195482 RepID=A0A9D5DJS4_9CRYT|nr:SET and PHD domain-containing protein [Cryptosporidium canis]